MGLAAQDKQNSDRPRLSLSPVPSLLLLRVLGPCRQRDDIHARFQVDREEARPSKRPRWRRSPNGYNADTPRLFCVDHTGQDTPNHGAHVLNLDEFIPRGPNGQVLWLSCDERIAGGLVAVRWAINVPKMTLNEAKELFDSVRNNRVGNDEGRYVVVLLDELEWLPLAISQAAAYMRRTLTTVEEWRESEIMAQRAYELNKRMRGDRHLDTIVSMERLASIYSQLGRLKEAEVMQIEIHRQRREILGGMNPYTIMSEVELALTYQRFGRCKRAEEIMVRALALLQEITGTTHHITVRNMANLVVTYHALGKYKEAEEMIMEVLTLQQNILGHKHLSTITTMGNISAIHQLFGSYQEAEKLGVEVLSLRREMLGDQDPDTIKAMARLVKTYRKAGKYKEAEEILVKALALRWEVLGDEHPDTVKIIKQLAYRRHQLERLSIEEG
ncbi:hypothetical protein THAR02_09648 [Trichoderma harzianum]|uniref:Uncharacterized protein n=1 Tax=Trichoderma harzianum TaxID=5544 RepID=A0A0F9ZCQ8_TRIHA|nr:hypothetical protein THAR02_09648 [Trichoderma harzianum]